MAKNPPKRKRKSNVIARARKAIQSVRAAKAATKEKEIKAAARDYERFGLFKPKRKGKLSAADKRTVQRIDKQWKEFREKDDWIFVPVKSKRKEKVLDNARKLEIPATDKGVFVAREGAKKAELQYDKKRDEFTVATTRAEKHGKSGRKKIITRRIPLAPLKAKDDAKAMLEAQTLRLKPLGKNERLAFKVIDGTHEGYSHSTFGSIDLLLQHIDRYERSAASKIHLFRHVIVVKTTVAAWKRDHMTVAQYKRRRSKARKRR